MNVVGRLYNFTEKWWAFPCKNVLSYLSLRIVKRGRSEIENSNKQQTYLSQQLYGWLHMLLLKCSWTAMHPLLWVHFLQRSHHVPAFLSCHHPMCTSHICLIKTWLYQICFSKASSFGDRTGLSISFEVASSFWKVGVTLLSERLRREPPRGVWGHAPPENFEI